MINTESKIDPLYIQEAKRLFGKHMWHSLTILEHKDPDKIRQCYWCKAGDSYDGKLTFVNIWGTVYVVTACEECYAKNNGIARDEL